MKKAIRIISIALVIIIVGTMLASCSKMLMGTYSGTGLLSKQSYTFSGNKVTLTLTVDLSVLGSSTTELKGTYEITKATDGTQSITFTFDDKDGSSYSGTYSFDDGKDDTGAFIKIGGSTYYKK